jgi:hypothetical protein
MPQKPFLTVEPTMDGFLRDYRAKLAAPSNTND